ncbi:MAG: EAL domain-containing protein [Campylobacteraceae bacterium]|nr:EAL domain-containing protein [Campylobacteraceae bacterium]
MKNNTLSIYVGRHPIFNIRGECFAYELLYRSCDLLNQATFEDNTQATARVIANLIHNLGLKAVIGDKIGFINVDEMMLFSDTLLLLPKENFRFEILEYTKVSLALCERIKYLHGLGYRFSLDDFDCSDEMIKRYEPLFPYVDLIKVDILVIGIDNLQESIVKLKKYGIELLAEKIEYYDQYEYCRKLSFAYFQCYFFEKPIIFRGKKIEPSTMNAIRLINCIHEEDSPSTISQKFSNCPDLVFNLLRHINSGAYHFRQEINNIQQMITLLGAPKIISWLGLFLYGDPKQTPFGEALFNNAKFRAKLMEQLAISCGKMNLANKAFLTGSLSLVDAYLGISMEDFLKDLSLDGEIKTALVSEEGTLGVLLCIAKEINHTGDIDHMLARLENPCFTKEQIYDACCMANAFVEESNQSK